MLNEQEFVELMCSVDEETRKKAEEMLRRYQTDQEDNRGHIKVTKALEEYNTKYYQKSKIYVSELEDIRTRSKDVFELISNSVRFGYVLGRRAEKNARRTRARRTRARLDK